MKNIKFLLLLGLGFISHSLMAQKLMQIKYKDTDGNIIYYIGAEGSDDVRFCDLYYNFKNSSRKLKIIVKKTKTIETELGDIIYPTLISLNNLDYQYKIEHREYITIKNNQGKTIRFNYIE